MQANIINTIITNKITTAYDSKWLYGKAIRAVIVSHCGFLLSCPLSVYIVALMHRNESEILFFVENCCNWTPIFRVSHTPMHKGCTFLFLLWSFLLLFCCHVNAPEHHIYPRFIGYLTITERSNTLPYMLRLDDKVNPYAQTACWKDREAMTYSLICLQWQANRCDEVFDSAGHDDLKAIYIRIVKKKMQGQRFCVTYLKMWWYWQKYTRKPICIHFSHRSVNIENSTYTNSTHVQK